MSINSLKAKRANHHKQHDDILKLRIVDQDLEFSEVLLAQTELWNALTETSMNQSGLSQTKFSTTSDVLHEHVSEWKKTLPVIALMAVAHIRWVVLVFAKKLHRLDRKLTPKDCPQIIKFCQGVSLSIRDEEKYQDTGEEYSLVNLPKLGRIEVFIHPDSKKDWNDAERKIVGATLSKEKKSKKKARWIIKLLFSKDKAVAVNKTQQKGFITKVTEEIKDFIHAVVNIGKSQIAKVLKALKEDGLSLSRATVYRVAASTRTVSC